MGTGMDGTAQCLRSSASSSSNQQNAPASPSAKAPYQMQFAEHDDDVLAKHLRHVFEELSVDGSKEILFVRACAPTADKRPDADDGQGFELATQFVHWHPPELQASGVDPSLTRMALCAAADGLPPPLLDQPGCAQYGGLEGGLRSLVKLFAPEVVVSSPHSCALQTAMVACDQLTEGPIIVHPDLKHIKKDLTLGGQFPEGKPKFQGLSASTLQAALTRQPFAHAASRVDLSMLDEVWFDPHLDFKGQKRRLRGLPSWLAQRPEQRVMIVTHNRVLRHLVGAHVGNGQYALARLCATGDLYTTPTIAPFVPRLLCENPDGRSGRRVLFVRHCQDETLPVVHNRAASARFLHWHDAAQRAADTEADGRRDPCLTELGIAAASTGIADSLRASMNAADGYGGVHGGLSKIMHSFAPELVVTSPLARAVQTALVAFDRTTVPVVVHPFIKELKKDYTFGGRFPDGKPGCAGSSWQQLRAAIERHPRSSGAPVDTSLLADDNQFDPLQSYEDQLANLRAFTHWLVKRPEKNIVVVSHGGVLRHLLHTELGHGQYVLTEPHVDKAAEPATKVHFTIVQFSSGVQPYFEN